jgi:hypothetical protein
MYGENSRFIKMWQKWRVLYMKTNIHFVSYLAQSFLESGKLRTKVVEKTKTHILWSKTFFTKPYLLWDNVEMYSRGGQATVDNMAHTLCFLDTYSQVYKHTNSFRVCKSVQHRTFNWINQPDSATSQVYYLSFKHSSTCFGHPRAHHQELQLQ